MCWTVTFGMSEFEFQLRYFIHFRTYILGKSVKPIFSQLCVIYHLYFLFARITLALITHESWYAIKQVKHLNTDTFVLIYMNNMTGLLAECLKCSSGARGLILGRVDFKKQYLIHPCLKLSIVRYRSRVSGAILGKE